VIKVHVALYIEPTEVAAVQRLHARSGLGFEPGSFIIHMKSGEKFTVAHDDWQESHKDMERIVREIDIAKSTFGDLRE
jgi:hypothetical protein